MDRFRNKYRIPSARAQWWNYGWSGVYFITICTAIREHFFGEIQNGNMILSKTGVISDILWHEIPTHAPNVELGDFVVMPNHIHGILIFNQPNDNIKTNVVTGFDKDDGNKNVKTGHALSLPNNDSTPGQKRFQNIGKNTVSSFVESPPHKTKKSPAISYRAFS